MSLEQREKKTISLFIRHVEKRFVSLIANVPS